MGSNICYSGGQDEFRQNYGEIYQWTGDDWEEVGRMKVARRFHAVSTIRMDDDAMQFCE